MKKRRKNYYRVIILNVEQSYCFDLGFLPVLFKKKIQQQQQQQQQQDKKSIKGIKV